MRGPFDLRLASLAHRPGTHWWVGIGADDMGGGWRHLRDVLVPPEMQPPAMQPHVTIVHPRHSNLGAQAWSAIGDRAFGGWFDASEVAIAAFDGRRLPSVKPAVLLLTVRGRKSGKERTTPVVYFRIDEQVVVAGTNNGEDRDPAWCLNLRAHQDAKVQIGRQTRQVRARIALGPERDHLWAEMTQQHPLTGSSGGRTLNCSQARAWRGPSSVGPLRARAATHIVPSS